MILGGLPTPARLTQNQAAPDGSGTLAVKFAALISPKVSSLGPAQRLGNTFGRIGARRLESGWLLRLDPLLDGGAPAAPTTYDGGLVLTADARIDNRAELSSALGITAAEGAKLADDELIIASYRRWGIDCAAQMIGDFAFALWDASRGRLLAACDPMGMRSMHYAQHGSNCWALAPTAELTLALLGKSAQLDRLGVAAWIAGRPLPDRSVLSGVQVLPPGHLMTLESNRVKIRRFWQFDPGRTLRYASPALYREHLLELLSRCVADRLPAGAGCAASQLSGGMDSTSVTALAAQKMAQPGRKLLAVSHLYSAESSCDERALIEQTAAHLGIRHQLLLPVKPFTQMPYALLYPPILDSPGTVLSPRYIDELQQVRAQGAQVLLTGSGGDEMTWGHSLSYSQRLLRGELTAVSEVIRGSRELELPLLRTLFGLFVRPLAPDAIRPMRHRWLNRRPWPDWIPADTAHRLQLQDVLYGEAERHFRNPALQARYSALVNSSTYHSVRSYEAVGKQVGVDVRHPFFDRRLAEFSFEIPDELWLQQRYPKWLLRKTMDGRLPDSVVWNRNKVVFDSFFALLIKGQLGCVRAILSHPGLQSLGLVDNRKLLAAFDSALHRDPPTMTVELLHALMTQVWFQQHTRTLGFC